MARFYPCRYALAPIIVGCLLVSAVHAKQTLGSPPVVEKSVCNGLIGTAFQLCWTYCEALDCDGRSLAGHTRVCQRVLDAFQRETPSTPPCGGTCSGVDAAAIMSSIDVCEGRLQYVTQRDGWQVIKCVDPFNNPIFIEGVVPGYNVPHKRDGPCGSRPAK